MILTVTNCMVKRMLIDVRGIVTGIVTGLFHEDTIIVFRHFTCYNQDIQMQYCTQVEDRYEKLRKDKEKSI